MSARTKATAVQTAPEAVMQNKYLNCKQVGERYSVTSRSIWRYVSEGKIPPPKTLFGSIRRWDVTELEQWEMAHVA